MTQSLDSVALRKRVGNLGLRAAQLAGRKSADEEQQASLTAKVADAKGRLALAPQVVSVFEGLQQLAHERSVGSLETLLSAILQDVLPSEGRIRLLTAVKANSTHLDVMVDKGGKLEDVLDGNGGALTNVICAGLRFAALTRTQNRRLMVMDEPDCWVSLDRVPHFARTISQIATKGKIQTLVITHKSKENFEKFWNLVQFVQDDAGKVGALLAGPVVNGWESVEQPGIREIELINVRRHEHTRVPCFPGPTVYMGKSNLGKSTAIMGSFKAVAYGESDDSIIRHGCEEAKIIFHLENNQRVEWSRHLKRSPTVIYKHWIGDELIAESRPRSRNQPPEWVEEVLGITRVDDLDIQVGNQKKPVFLLDDTASRRAQILSVGKESSHLPVLMRAYEQMKSADRELVKQGESELARLKLRLAYLQKVPKLAESQAELAEQAESIIRLLEQREQLRSVLEKLEAKTSTVERLVALSSAMKSLPAELPALESLEPLQRTLIRLEKAARLPDASTLPQLPDVPELQDVARIVELGKRIGEATRKLKAAERAQQPLPEVPVLNETEMLKQALESFTRRQTALTLSARNLAELDVEMAAAQESLNKLIDELGSACPLCGGLMEHEHVEGTAHAH